MRYNREVAQNKSTSLRMRALGYKQILAPFKTFQGKWNEKRNGFLITITFNKMILHAKINNLALIIHYAFMMIDKSKMAMFLYHGDNLPHFLLCLFGYGSIGLINFTVLFYIFMFFFSDYIAEQKLIQYAQNLLS